MEWGKIYNIWLILLLFIVIYLSIKIYKWRENIKKKFADKNLFPFVFPITSSIKYGTKLIIFCVALLLIIISLMDPLYGNKNVKIKREGIDIVFLLDLSTSMNTQDVAPSRLEKATKLMTETLNQLGGDRTAFVIFATYAYTITPLTSDYSAVESYLQTLNTNLISYQGTNFLNAIEEAAKSFKNSANSSRLIVLISDGEDNEKTTNQAIQLAKDNNINIVTVGVGTKKGGPIPLFTDNYTEGYKKDNHGNIVISHLENRNLINLAQNTNGTYIHLENTQEALSKLIEYKTKLKKNEIDSSTTKDMNHVYQIFLSIAVFLLFVELLTSESKVFNKKNSKFVK